MQVKLVSKTQVDPDFELDGMDLSNPESLMIWIARVSSKKQNNPKYAKLLKFCIDQKHWSVFEMIDATFEIQTSRAMAVQILRHRSFCFQEFSQRYQVVDSNEVELCNARKQAKNNRQSSLDDLSEADKQWFITAQNCVTELSNKVYKKALDKGIARECARFVLPANNKTRLFMKGSLRSWIHYVNIRTDDHVQLEHREIAIAIREILVKQFPTVAEALGWD